MTYLPEMAKFDSRLLFLWSDVDDPERWRGGFGMTAAKVDETGERPFVRVLLSVYHQDPAALDAFLATSPTAVASKHQTWWEGRHYTSMSVDLSEAATIAAIPDVTRIEAGRRYSIPPRGVRGRSRRLEVSVGQVHPGDDAHCEGQ